MGAIDIYADIWCPFADVGLRCVVDRRSRRRREDLLLNIRAWPLELVNQAPLDPYVTAQHVDELRSQVAPDLFRGFDPENFPTSSLPALACVHAAYGKSQIAGEAMSFAVRDALFEEGRDISRHDVLADISDSLKVGSSDLDDERAVIEDWEDGIRRGVRGSPHFFCGEFEAFCPSLDISRDKHGHLIVKNDMAVLERFLARCLGK